MKPFVVYFPKLEEVHDVLEDKRKRMEGKPRNGTLADSYETIYHIYPL